MGQNTELLHKENTHMDQVDYKGDINNAFLFLFFSSLQLNVLTKSSHS